jgi:sulfite exporter TauE/SafE
MRLVAEAFLLGISSGPACLASCGPVLLPALAAQQKALRGTGALLAQFLAGRLAGYLGFAVVAWLLGVSIGPQSHFRILAFGLSNLGLAVLLVVYAFLIPAPCRGHCPRHRNVAPALLGLLTGLNLCPPFVAAGVRAAQGASLGEALLFFLLFFVGTSVWFAPSVALSVLRRFEAVATVARLTLFVLAAYYGYLAVVVLGREWIHG